MFKFCWHNFGNWSEVIQDYSGSLQQVCKCTKCGAIKRRKAISILMSQLRAEQVNNAVIAADREKNK